MKKLLVMLIVGGVGWFAYRHLIASPEKRSCQTLAALCGDHSALDKCTHDVEELGRMDSKALTRLDACLNDARSCAEGTGCLVGVGFGAASNLFNDFFKGMGKAMPH
jgi:hypothetical protein